jgi:hypothetical protein
MLHVITAGASLLALQGCATVQMKASFSSMGEYDAGKNTRVNEQYVELRDGGPQAMAGKPEVRVLVNALPKGIALKDGAISVTEGYEHQILGKFRVGPDFGFFPNYRAGWRDYYCYPQIPLVWVTLAMWAIFVPAYYPCITTGYNAKSDIIEAVKQITTAARGNLAVVSFLGEEEVEPGEEERAVGATGFILIMDPRFQGRAPETTPIPKSEGMSI